MQASPGAVIAGRYRLVAPLGHGGMGVVWQAEHLALGSAVAIKLMNERATAGSAAGERFLREARAVASLASPHVVQIVDFGVEGDTPFLVMEMLQGETLGARLRRQGRLDFQSVLRIVTETARALERAHQSGVVHRDLKPENIFLVRDIEHEVVKVLDFGVAKVVGDETSQLTHSGAVLGTPHYMSPEQARGRRELDHRTDLWALGIIAYEAVTGRRPFESDVLGDLLVMICTDPIPVPSTIAAVPPGFDAWFARATERDPARRFSSALEMSDALRALVGQPITVTSLPAPPPSAALPAKKRGGLGLVIGVALALGVLLLGATAIAAFAFLGGPEWLAGETAAPASASSAVPAILDGGTPELVAAVDAAAPASSVAASTKPGGVPTAHKPGSPTATATATAIGAATPTAAPAPPPASNPCIPACAKLKTCAPKVKCNPSDPCVGPVFALAQCVNSKSCANVMECL